MSGPGRTHAEQAAAERAARVQRRAEAHPLTRLQRQLGNQAVAGLLAQRAEEDELQAARDPAIQRAAEDEEALQAARDTTLQREGDEEEMQAARDPALQRAEEDELQASPDPTIQRAGEEDELQASRDPALQRAEEDEEALQAKAEVGADGGPVSDTTAQRIQAIRGAGGAPLDPGTRTHMESAFDTSFADVRLHTGGEASAVSRQIGALAFTAGSDVFMRDDAYQHGTPDGHRLLGHELTHVVQQRSMPASSGGMRVGPAGDHYEQAADVATSASAAQRRLEE